MIAMEEESIVTIAASLCAEAWQKPRDFGIPLKWMYRTPLGWGDSRIQ